MVEDNESGRTLSKSERATLDAIRGTEPTMRRRKTDRQHSTATRRRENANKTKGKGR